jgi:hypothetical protein
MRRILKPGGTVRLQTMQGAPHSEASYGGCHGAYYPSLAAFSENVADAGFTIAEASEQVCDGFTWLWVTGEKK